MYSVILTIELDFNDEYWYRNYFYNVYYVGSVITL